MMPSDAVGPAPEGKVGTRVAPSGSTARIALGTLLGVYVITILFTASHHEMWRDEVRALSLAIGADHVWDLPAILRNEGHPLAWYVLLRGAHALYPSPVVLPVLAGLIAVAAIGLFAFRAPFPIWIKALFMFSVLPIYEYSVMARNYGISMLAMFAFATLYPQRRRYPWAIAMVLVFLAQTNVHSTAMAGLLTLLWVSDDARELLGSTGRRRDAVRWVLAVASVAISIGVAFLITRPDQDTAIYWLRTVDLRTLGRGLLDAVSTPSFQLQSLLPIWGLHWLMLLVAGLILGVIGSPVLALLGLAATLWFETVFRVIYPGMLRHQGLWFVFLMTLYWLRYSGPTPPRTLRAVRYLEWSGLHLVLPLVLLSQVAFGFEKVKIDVRRTLSSNQAFGEAIRREPRLRHAIVVGEPDFLLESLPYYVDNPTYLVREGRFGTTVSFTTRSRPRLGLSELHTATRMLCRVHRRPVLIAIGYGGLDSLDITPLTYSFHRTWTTTPIEVATFLRDVRVFGDFRRSRSDENFTVYELPCSSGGTP